jgi:DNA-binding response OmpR family regulator
VLIAIPEVDKAKQLADALQARGARTLLAHDGVDAVLELQRQLPKAAVVAAHLPKMFGFQVCELVKRNESLRGTWIVLAGAIHNQERYRRPAVETYGADAYVEMPDLPDGVLPLLARGGVLLRDAPAPRARSAPAPRVAPEPQPAPAPVAVPVLERAPEPTRPRAADGLDEQRAKAERLARIIVSDIVLYNEQKFSEAMRRGNVVEALDADLAEGRHLFQERIDARVRAERDYLADELLRVAKQRGAK